MDRNVVKGYLNQVSKDMMANGNKTADKGKEDWRSYQQGKCLKGLSITISFKGKGLSSLTITNTLENGAMARNKAMGSK